jgi:hypothetical protein
MATKKTAKKPTKPAKKTVRRKKTAGRKAVGRTAGFSRLECNILISKGLSKSQISQMEKKDIRRKEDLKVVGDALTLEELCGIPSSTGERAIAWALAGPSSGGTLVVESGDSVSCVSCGKRQPKDYKSGDLCVFCGKQAEPVSGCYWCGASGPGKFCRSCGATFVHTGELELAILLKRDGLSKEEIPPRLSSLSAAEKEILWGRVRSRH